MPILLVVPMWVFLHISVYCQCVAIEADFRVARGHLRIPGHISPTVYTTQSKLECAVLCSLHKDYVCSYALFKPRQTECHIFNWIYIRWIYLNTTESSDSTLVIIARDSKYMYIDAASYPRFYYGEGKQHCELLGENVAPVDDYDKAGALGWNLCSCGYTANGNAYRWCKSGIVRCKNLRYGVHCKIGF